MIEYHCAQTDARRKARRAEEKKNNSNSNAGKNDNNNNVNDDDDDDDVEADDDDDTDLKTIVFALDALVPVEEGGDLANRKRPWLEQKGGFCLVHKELPTIAIFLLSASVLRWRLTALGGERHAEVCDAMLLKLQKSYAKKMIAKNGPKARKVLPEAITHDVFTAADASPLLPYRNDLVQQMERTRKMFMLELAYASRLPNEVLAPEEQRRMGALRGWAAAEAKKAADSFEEGGRKVGMK